MGMPQVPERDKFPCPMDVVLQIIESVAIEELAMAHIMNAEGEKLQEFIRKFKQNEICEHGVNLAVSDTKNIINSLIMKEWLMLSKISTSFQILEQEKIHIKTNEHKSEYEDNLESQSKCKEEDLHNKGVKCEKTIHCDQEYRY